MTPAERIEAALQAAFDRCDTESSPLSDRQKQILLQLVEELTRLIGASDFIVSSNTGNPLDQLEPNELNSFLEFVKQQELINRPWKIELMNDWLNNRDSGAVQFIRDRYGLQWLNRIQPIDIAQYAEITSEEVLKLKVGDRIEVSNGLWEWVQENGPCSREWIKCTVIQVAQTGDGNGGYTNCTIRFNNGAEYEIQGMYEWNRPNWRWTSN